VRHPSNLQLRKLVGVGNYQFGQRIGSFLFNKRVHIECSRKTGRVRHIYDHDRLIATLRPKDGYLALTTHAANTILSKVEHPPNLVVVQTEVSDPIKAGGDVFAKHIVCADRDLKVGEEVIVTDEEGLLIGVGAATLSGREMCAFKRGVAVKLRKGLDETEHAASEASRMLQSR
jgi:7-cyano-7-deazaguanine tRNA-ribosyltransferase